MGLDWRVIGRGRSVTARFACIIIFSIYIYMPTVRVDVSALILNPTGPNWPYMNYEYNKYTTYGDLKIYLANFHNGVPDHIGINIYFTNGTDPIFGASDDNLIWPAAQSGILNFLYAWPRKYYGGKKSRKTKKSKRRKRIKTRKRKRKRKTKRRTRKKIGRGIAPSKMAKVGVAALAASTAMGQGMGHGISPSRGTAAAVNHFKTVACSDFHIGDIVEHSEDHGQPTDHYRPVLQAALGKKKSCKRRGQPMRKPKPEKIKRNPNESGRQFKKRKREEKRKAKVAKEQERIEREVMEEMEREEESTNTGSGQQQENTGYLDHLERVGKYTAAGLLAMEGVRRLGRPRGRGRGPRFARELTPERRE